jgi:DNA excision repair protein ERCC-2
LSFLGVPRHSKGFFSFKSAEIGQAIHQKIQIQKKIENSNYKTEYFVKHQLFIEEWKIIIRGRIDLFVRTPDSVVIEEIKSFSFKEQVFSPEDPRINPFVLQLKCYAWILNQIEVDLPKVLLRLILVDRYIDSHQTINISYQDMSNFITEKIKTILSIEKVKHTNSENKIRSLAKLQFPFDFRAYQKEIIQQIEETLDKELNIIIEAPSGLGKTVVSIYPLLSKSIIENTKLFFLTAKSTQRRIVEQTLKLFQQQEVEFLAIILKAKEKMCVNSIYFCHEDYCPFLKNYVNSYPETQLNEFLQHRGVIDPESIEKAALATMGFCPFEFALDISLEADVIVGDYNYVFHPYVALQRFFGEYRSKKKFFLIIDEAHNLINRSLSYYSHSLSLRRVIELNHSMQQLKKKFKGIPLPIFLPPIIKRIFRSLRSEQVSSITTHILERLDLELFQKVLGQFEDQITNYVRYLVERELHWPDDPILDFYYYFRNFIETIALAQNAEEFSILYNSHEGEIKILCKDASPFLQQRLSCFKSAIAISATITPFPFYRDLLGLPVEKTFYKRYPSPFPQENRRILVVPDIDTRYKQRGYYYETISALIKDVLEVKPGRYFVFFPSFEFVHKVAQFFKPKGDLVILIQNTSMHESERREFIHTIENSDNVLALAVTAGIFAEGVDFPGILDGVIVISPSLPAVTFERELLRQYYEEKYSNGFAYAYQFPGLTRTFQAAGRLIRRPSDQGIILLIGRRFASSHYSSYFPPFYYQNTPRELITDDPIREIKLFWNNNEIISSTDSRE